MVKNVFYHNPVSLRMYSLLFWKENFKKINKIQLIEHNAQMDYIVNDVLSDGSVNYL